MAPLPVKSGLSVGQNRGHIVTRRELAPRPSDRKGVCIFLINRDFQIVDYRNLWVYLNHISSELVPNALNRLLYNFVSYFTG